MKLVRFRTNDKDKNGVVINGGLVEINPSLLDAPNHPLMIWKGRSFTT
jgi:hypothetical protein